MSWRLPAFCFMKGGKQAMNCEEKYPNIKVGDTIRLIQMEGETQMKKGMTGTVEFFDAIQIHVRWKNGSSLALIPEIDQFEVLPS